MGIADLQSPSCSHSKHFTHWVISPAHKALTTYKILAPLFINTNHYSSQNSSFVLFLTQHREFWNTGKPNMASQQLHSRELCRNALCYLSCHLYLCDLATGLDHTDLEKSHLETHSRGPSSLWWQLTTNKRKQHKVDVTQLKLHLHTTSLGVKSVSIAALSSVLQTRYNYALHSLMVSPQCIFKNKAKYVCTQMRAHSHASKHICS